jgi:hypothetical protein
MKVHNESLALFGKNMLFQDFCEISEINLDALAN